MFEFDFWGYLYDQFGPDTTVLAKEAFTRYYTEHQTQVNDFEKLLESISSLDFYVHVLAASIGITAENISRSKDFSVFRSLLYYFATYSFTTTVLINRGVSIATSNLASFISNIQPRSSEDFDEDYLSDYMDIDDDF